MTFDWHIITGEYPPQPGGVSDYTWHVAHGLVQAGDRVRVWAPAFDRPDASDQGVEVRRLSGHFGPLALAQLCHELPQRARVLVQYVPHAFGWKAMNLPFCAWLWSKRGDPVWVMFHEVAFPIKRNQPVRYKLLGVVNRCMSWMTLRSAERVWVSIPAWEHMLRGLSSQLPAIEWLPVPSAIPVIDDPSGIEAVRTRYTSTKQVLLGHFGTYGPDMAALLRDQILTVLNGLPHANMLLLGRGGESFARDFVRTNPGLLERVNAPGPLNPADLSRSISACEVMLQPDPNGVSSRRTSIMAALQHGRPVVTTRGPLTEEIWIDTHAVALTPQGDHEAALECVRQLLGNPGLRQRMGAAAIGLYDSRFDLKHTITALRAAA